MNTRPSIRGTILGLLLAFSLTSLGNALPRIDNNSVTTIVNPITIDGASVGTNTGLHLNMGDQIEITATGSVNTWPENPDNPWGGPDGNGYPCTSECLLPSAQFGALIGRIANGSWFFVGSHKVLNADSSGELILAVNDTISDNNIGYYTVSFKKACRVSFFSQRNEAWEKHPLRTRNNACSAYCSTIGRCGCTLTSAAMVFNSYGANTDPPQLSDCMDTSACPFSWKTSISCSNGGVNRVNKLGFSWDRLDQELNLNHRPVILGMCKKGTCHLDYDGDPNTHARTHWVVVLSGHGTDPEYYLIHDPWYKCGANIPLATRSEDWQFVWMSIYESTIPCSSLTAIIPSCVNRGANPEPVQSVSGLNVLSLNNAYSQLEVSPSSVISGTVWIYTRTALTMTVEVTATSSAGNVTEMLIWSDAMSNTTWQPFTPFVWLPVSEYVYARFRDELGNATGVYSDTINPVGPPNVPFEVFLPLIKR